MADELAPTVVRLPVFDTVTVPPSPPPPPEPPIETRPAEPPPLPPPPPTLWAKMADDNDPCVLITPELLTVTAPPASVLPPVPPIEVMPVEAPPSPPLPPRLWAKM